MSLATDFELQAKTLHDALRGALGKCSATTVFTAVTIVSMNDGAAGQWILNDPSQDRAVMAARLRLCADLLERSA
jgi:hypothetical protein